jgi:peroxiredoxin Q/BCP
MLLNVGDDAPEFEGEVADGSKIKLSDFKDKLVILYFYPKDNTPGCSIEASSFNNLKSEFDKRNIIIIGISKDDLNSHKDFSEKLCLNFPLISDSESDICEQYGVYVQKSMFGKKYMGIDRVTFLIDKQAKIAYIWNKINVMSHANNVLEYIDSII